MRSLKRRRSELCQASASSSRLNSAHAAYRSINHDLLGSAQRRGRWRGGRCNCFDFPTHMMISLYPRLLSRTFRPPSIPLRSNLLQARYATRVATKQPVTRSLPAAPTLNVPRTPSERLPPAALRQQHKTNLIYARGVRNVYTAPSHFGMLAMCWGHRISLHLECDRADFRGQLGYDRPHARSPKRAGRDWKSLRDNVLWHRGAAMSSSATCRL